MRDQLVAIYERHLLGQRPDVPAIEAKIGRPLQAGQEARPYELAAGGVAFIEVEGVIIPKATLFSSLSGAAASQSIRRQVQAAAADSGAKSILLSIDSPGGSVVGLYELVAAVREAANVKPVVVISDGVLASAAYHFASAANEIRITDQAVMVGSIGAMAVHRDLSKAEEKLGLKTTEIVSGEYKNALSASRPLPEHGRVFLQDMVDRTYSIFAKDIADFRGVSVEAVLEHMGGGRVFLGQQAIDAGLVDEFASIDATLEAMATDPGKFSGRRVARIKPVPAKSAGGKAGTRAAASLPLASKGNPPMENQTDTQAAATPAAPLTLESLRRDHPTVHAAALAAGAEQERERIAGVRACLLPGHEELIARLAADGKTTLAEAALAVVKASQETTEAMRNARSEEAPKPVKGGAPPAEGGKSREQLAAEAETLAANEGIDILQALKRVGVA